MDPPENKVAALLPLFAFFAFLVAALLFWCLISSCLGTPILRSLSNLWDYTVLGAQSQNTGRIARRRPAYGEGEIWEMEYRGRGG
ncbi:hypothetical protein B0H34DRAFT_20484 [Crassisporium funariophilum]|nr:hypothetical protein B0H34DRAFT_20484 [Crassisporium funariophilum]